MVESLTWLEYGVDQVGHLLRVEQAICTTGVCNTLLIPVCCGIPNGKISGSREGAGRRLAACVSPPCIYFLKETFELFTHYF